MNRIESFFIASILAVGVPLLLLTFCWFGLIAVWMLEIGGLVDSAVIALLVASIVVGVVVNVCCLRRWTRGFYRANMTLMVLLYVISSVLAILLFMGVPLGTLVLGILAGLYVGRRHCHAATSPEVFARACRRVSLFTCIVVGVLALPVGMLALFAGEEPTVRALAESLGLAYTRMLGVAIILALCVLLMLTQYWLARGAAVLAYQGWKKRIA